MLTPIEKVTDRCVVCKEAVVGYLVKGPRGRRYVVCRDHFFQDVDSLLEEKAAQDAIKAEDKRRAKEESRVAAQTSS